MNRTTLTTAVIAACVASLCVLAWATLLAPGTVNAAPDPAPKAATKPIRIAIVNLEEISRSTPLYSRLRSEWEEARADIKSYHAKLQRQHDTTLQRIENGGGAHADEDDLVKDRVRLQALRETLKAAKEEGDKYLNALIADFQKQVLTEVMINVRRYMRQEGYAILLQDYNVEDDPADFMSGDPYAQSLLAKPVLDAPGSLDGSNVFVTDITQEMIAAMKSGGVPEDPDDG
ncbi:MAG: hypothetical protein H6839_11125 [Planctomycetes bacterium]|nr:hypothetical protein [Planctomycetota bacterium]